MKTVASVGLGAAALAVAGVLGIGLARATERAGEPQRSMVRPLTEEALANASVSKTGKYELKVGDVLEIEYSFTSAGPGPSDVKLVLQPVQPPVVDAPWGTLDVAQVSGDGKRIIGQSSVVAHLVARRPGTATVNLVVDEKTYAYTVEVSGDTVRAN